MPAALLDAPSVPGEVLTAALELRQQSTTSAMLRVASEYIDVEGLSHEDGRLFKHRLLGGLATRLALASYVTRPNRTRATPFFNLDEADQSEVLVMAADYFARRLGVELEAGGMALEDVLKADQQAANVCRAADPAGVPHALVRNQLHGYKRAQRSLSERWRRLQQYANIGIGTYPDDPPPQTAVGSPDVVLVQAFGRNAVPDKELLQVRQVYDETANGDDVTMWNLLDESGFDAGLSNQALAVAVAPHVMDPGKGIETVIQWEVAYALWQHNPQAYARYANSIHTLWPQTGFYPTTEVKADSLAVMDRVGLYNPRELAHRDMMVRAMAILSKLGIEAEPLVADVPFDPNSVQAQVRSEPAWKRREALTRIHHVLFRHVKF